MNTRADLGPCRKIHDEAIRKEYQVDKQFAKFGIMRVSKVGPK